MKRILFLALVISGVLAGTPVSSRAAGTNEAALIAVLESKTSSPTQKDAACSDLKRIATKDSVKALSALLTDPTLSHSARYVLETLPGPEANAALLQALPKTFGLMQAGIINSLAMRGDTAAVPKIGKLLSSSDTNVAIASAEVLGRIGGSKALDYLQADVAHSTNGVHLAEVDGLLTLANRSLEAGKHKDALKLFESLYATEKSDTVRQAAYRGIIMSSGIMAVAKMTDAIAKNDGPAQSAALQVASQWEGSDATQALAALLPTTSMPVQLALIQCLSQRNDPSAIPALVKLLPSQDITITGSGWQAKSIDSQASDFRQAVLLALGKLGDASLVDLLGTRAIAGDAKERAAALQALAELHRGPVTAQMIDMLKHAPAGSKVGSVMLKSLGDRGDKSAIPALLDWSQNGPDTDRADAMQALAKLADGSQVPQMVELVKNAKSDDQRSAAADALSLVFQRLQTYGVKFDLTAFVAAVQNGSVETRLALLPLCNGQEATRAVLRTAMTDANAQIHDAAIHALCDTIDPELLPDLVKLASDTNQTPARLLAIRGCVRLTTQEETVKLSNDAKLDTLNAILAAPLDTQEKRVVLSGLSNIADAKSLALAVKMLDDTAVRAETEQAVVRIASDISGKNPIKARDALKKIIAESTNPDIKKTAEDALKKIK